jgi:hypothetical protein
VPRGASQSMTFRLATNDTATTATAAKTIFRCFGRCVVLPDPLNPLVFYRGGEGCARAGDDTGIIPSDVVCEQPRLWVDARHCVANGCPGRGLAVPEINA